MAQNTKFTVDGSNTNTSNPFPLNGFKYNVKLESNISDGNVKQSAITLQKEVPTQSGKDYVAYATSYDGGKTWVEPGGGKPPKPLSASSGLSASELKSLQPGGALNKQVVSAANQTAKKAGATPKQQEQLKKGNDSNTPETKTDTDAQQIASANKEEFDKEAKTNKGTTRTQYGNVRYPLDLQVEYQDCIKFSIVRYTSSGLSQQSIENTNRVVTVEEGIPRLGQREILGTVVLPIPGGISDSNMVDWQEDKLDEITKSFANIAQSAITKGGTAGADAAAGEAGKLNAPETKIMAASKFTELATGAANIMQRTNGTVANPNLELLFNGPSLRSFSFSFRLSPREEDEAKAVRKIIRFFKQAMSAKRSQNSLLLKSPHTFAISYITSKNKQHPYLNRFKECALTQCNVNYTPDGNYMTFAGEPSMTSYELTLQFQELVPLYDDDYGNENVDQLNNIGF